MWPFRPGPGDATSAIPETMHGIVLLHEVPHRTPEEQGLTTQETAQAIGKSRTFLEPGWGMGPPR